MLGQETESFKSFLEEVTLLESNPLSDSNGKIRATGGCSLDRLRREIHRKDRRSTLCQPRCI
jgi:hypothetical protein